MAFREHKYRLERPRNPRQSPIFEFATSVTVGAGPNWGNALASLGERENSTTRLEQAVAAYQAALEEWTRERVPLQWAMTQNNLGTTLASLGKRESGTTRLEQAVAAYQAALEERTRERVPLVGPEPRPTWASRSRA
jgi:tetratricopeptide (TPR) repeat protein